MAFRERYNQSRWQGRRGKYNIQRESYSGTSYGSKAEAKVAWELDMQLRAEPPQIKCYRKQVVLPLYAAGEALACGCGGRQPEQIGTYKIDFIVEHLDGTTEYVEVKGFETRDWRLKWAIFEANMSGEPNVKLTVERRR